MEESAFAKTSSSLLHDRTQTDFITFLSVVVVNMDFRRLCWRHRCNSCGSLISASTFGKCLRNLCPKFSIEVRIMLLYGPSFARWWRYRGLIIILAANIRCSVFV